MTQHQSISRIKGLAREHMFGKYGSCISALISMQMAILFITLIIKYVCNVDTLVGLILYLVLTFLLTLFTSVFSSGQCFLYLNVACEKPVLSNFIFHGFSHHPDKAVLIQLFLSGIGVIFCLPWYIIGTLYEADLSPVLIPYYGLILLWIIVVAYLALTYNQAFYLLYDFPDQSAASLLSMSRRYMKGNRLRYLLLNLSFLPLFLAGILSFGIGFFWIMPYVYASEAEFFLDLVKE